MYTRGAMAKPLILQTVTPSSYCGHSPNNSRAALWCFGQYVMPICPFCENPILGDRILRPCGHWKHITCDPQQTCSLCFTGPLEKKFNNHVRKPDIELVFTQALIPVRSDSRKTTVGELRVHVHTQVLRVLSKYFEAALSPDSLSADTKLEIPVSGIHASSIWEYFGIVYGTAANDSSRPVDIVLGVAKLEHYFGTSICQWYLTSLVQPALIIEVNFFESGAEQGELLRTMVKVEGACRNRANSIFWDWIKHGRPRTQDAFLKALIPGTSISSAFDKGVVISAIKGTSWKSVKASIAKRVADTNIDAVSLVRYLVHVCDENETKAPKGVARLREAVESLWTESGGFRNPSRHLTLLSEIIDGASGATSNRKRKREENGESSETSGPIVLKMPRQ